MRYERWGVVLGLAGALAVGAAGCGGDPLIGTWRLNFNMSMLPPSVASLRSDYTFAGDASLGVVSVVVYTPGSPVNASCTETYRATGITWSSNTANGVMTLTLGGTAVTTLERTGCTTASQNQAPSPYMGASAGTPANGSVTYAIAGTTLTITSMNAGTTTTTTLTRQ